jgi:formimidoylglutamate deiminase
MRAATVGDAQRALARLQRDLRGLGERNPDDFGRGARRCCTWPRRWIRSRCSESPRRCTARCWPPATERWASSTTSTIRPTARPTTIPTRSPRRARAAIEVGLEIVLIPAAYHRGGHPRFHDPDVESFLERVDGLREWAGGRDGVSVAVAAHSVRAVPPDWLEAIAGYASDHGLPRHVHASEQPREVRECRAQHGASPIERWRAPVLGPRTSVVHAIHVDERDIAPLADSRRSSSPSDDRGNPRRRPPAGVGLSRRRRAPHRLDSRSVSTLRGGPRARDRRAPRRHDAVPCCPLRRPFKELVRNGLASPVRGGDTIGVDLDHPDLRGVGNDDWRSRGTCASAGVVARQASRVRAGGGNLS